MISWIFGRTKENIVHISEPDKSAGYLILEKARVRWFLSIDYNDIPIEIRQKGSRTYRSITIDNIELEFSEGFAELHTQSYNEILAGHGFGLDDSLPSIESVYTIRNSQPVGLKGEFHPILKNVIK
jgi:UDP-N-acetyl-2-amino-2-deoxyglucuronate dehydrogenase